MKYIISSKIRVSCRSRQNLSILDYMFFLTGMVSENRLDWSNFDDDLTDYILKKLPFSDLLRCRDVCRSWRCIAHTHISSSPMKSPVLVLPKHYIPRELCSEKDGCYFEDSSRQVQLLFFFNPVTNKLYKLSHKSRDLLKGTSFVGSSNGWALFRKKTDLVVFNASIDVCIHIPCAASYRIKKALLLGDLFLDRKSNNAIVVLRGGLYSGLRFAVSGDKQFRDILAYESCPNDIAHFNRLVYVVLNKGFIQAWDFSEMGRTSPTMVENYQPSFNPGKELHPDARLRLMDSLGELWLVSKSSWGMKSKFRVYKLDFKERKWVDMNSLGDRVVCLIRNQSISFSPLETSKYKRNCVYFEDHDGMHGLRSIYIYNFEDGSVA